MGLFRAMWDPRKSGIKPMSPALASRLPPPSYQGSPIIALYVLFPSVFINDPQQTFEQQMLWASLTAQLVKNPPAVQETPVQFLGWEDLLEKA